LIKVNLPAPDLVQMLMGGVICGLATLLYIRSPAVAASDRQLLAQVLHGKEARILQWLGIVGPARPAARGA
jgi:hypothetical protein